MDDGQRLWTWLPLTEAIMSAVVASFRDIPGSVFLRTADALHLATAREHGFHEIYSNDAHILAAATFFGLVGNNVLRP